MACTSVNGAGPLMNTGGAHASSADIPKDGIVISIQQVLNAPAGFSGKEVLVQGKFKGWNGTCSSSSVLTRSDWVIEDETGCIYVTGAVPAGLSPMQPHNELIKVVGRVMVNDAGRPIIKVSRSDRQSH